MRLVDIDKVKKNLDERNPDWTAEDYVEECEDAAFYSSIEDFIADHDYEIEMMMFAPEIVPDEPQWIPCSERLPEENCRVLISTEYKTTCIAYYSKEQWHPDGYKGAIFKPIYVLAWMPMPDAYEPPEVKADE